MDSEISKVLDSPRELEGFIGLYKYKKSVSHRGLRQPSPRSDYGLS